jgi:hypothetical protein
MAKDSRWVDPAPLEVSRPRLPWWTLLPGWVKFVLSPVAALVLLGWTSYQLGRAIYRVRAALPERYKIVVPVRAGCGLRQGETFGLSPEDSTGMPRDQHCSADPDRPERAGVRSAEAWQDSVGTAVVGVADELDAYAERSRRLS